MPNILAFITTFAIYGLLRLFLRYTQDAKEPPVISTVFPFIGPMIGLMQKTSKYYVELRQLTSESRDKFDLPIYTLRLPGARLYVINSASLIPSVQRQFKTLAFPPIEAKGAMGVCGTSKTANDILNTNTNGEDGDWGYSMTFYKMLHRPLAPGTELNKMNHVMAEKVSASVDRIKEGKTVQLFEFIKQEIGMATTDTVYGPQNPFKDSAVTDSFWKFEKGIMFLLLGLYPSIFAKESFAAREYMARAFEEYFVEGSHETGSCLVKSRFNHSTEHGIPIEDIAKFKVGGALAILSNTVPAAFWMIYHLYSDSIVLEECRQELSKVIQDTASTVENGEVIKICTIDMSRMKISCHVLLSTLKESLRVHSVGVATRLVMEDHMLDNKYLQSDQSVRGMMSVMTKDSQSVRQRAL